MPLGDNLYGDNKPKNTPKTQGDPVQAEQLRELQTQVQAMNEAAIVSETDEYGTIIYVNDKFCETSKYAREELIGKPHNIIRHPDTPKETFKGMWETIKEGKVFKAQIKNRAKDGSIYWVDATITPVLDASGKPYKYIGVRHDITAQKLYEEEIQRQVEEVRKNETQLFSARHELAARVDVLNAAALMSEADPHGTITFVNDKFCEVSGFSKEELMGQPHNIVRHPETPKAVFKEMWETIQAGKIFHGVYKNKKKDGGFYWVDATIAPVMGDDGKPYKYIGVRFDITEQKEQAAQLQSVFSAINRSNGVIEMSSEGEILSVNDRFLKAIGYTREELVGQHHSILVDPQRAQSERYKKFWEKLRSGEFDEGTYPRRHKDGHTIFLEATYNIIFAADGTVERVMKIARDVTQQRRRDLENAGKLAAIDQSNHVAEFDPQGNFLTVNASYAEAVGFAPEELIGKPHTLLLEKSYAESQEYEKLWQRLAEGEYDVGSYPHVNKKGERVWFEGTLNPIRDLEGNIQKVVKYVQDITARRSQNSKNRGKLAAIDRSNLVAEFNLDGTFRFANENYLNAVGYTEEELLGKHHSMLVEEGHKHSEQYQNIWKHLQEGSYDVGTYPHINKKGERVWLEGTYNAIRDWDGKITHYVKYVLDVTERRTRNSENRGKLAAIDISNVVAEFDLQGNLLHVNDNFCEAVGFSREELVGKHHSILVDKGYAGGAEYKDFWRKLNAGEFVEGTFPRRGKEGQRVWLEGAYNPIRDWDGNLFKIVKYATDVTRRRTQNSENRGKLAAIDISNLVVEFDLEGNILHANDNFLEAVKYSRDELVGKHHSVLVDEKYKRTAEYQNFWKDLTHGDFKEGAYPRIDKFGERVWLEGTYNPIRDWEGGIFKIVKYVRNVTDRRTQNAENRGKLAAIRRSNGMVEFDREGYILDVNENFAQMMGYTKQDLIGKHHSSICEPEYANSSSYKTFWENLRRGDFETGEYKRIGKNGKEVWLQATYNPIWDTEGNTFKVVKYATDNTDFKTAFLELSRFLEAFRKGDFSAEFNVNLEGLKNRDLAQMIDNNLQLRDRLRNFINEVNRVVDLAGREGKLKERLQVAEAEGAWAGLVDSVNELLESISKPLVELDYVIEGLAEGDLTRKVTHKGQGDIKEMIEDLEAALESLTELLSQIEDSSNIIDASADAMIRRFRDMQGNTKEVTAAIQQIAKGMDEQVKRTDESSKLAEDMRSASQDVFRKSEIINRSAQAGVQSCQNGMKTIQQLIASMSQIEESATSTSGSIKVLNDRSEEITQTLSVIQDIANQTNLLALNAAIEAARAGEAGRGFAVVAEEIRKLAEDSRKSAVEIEKVIKVVQKDVAQATRTMDRMEGSVNDGNSATRDAREIFELILNSSQETFDLSKDVQTAADTQGSSIAEIVRNIEQIVVVSEQTASGTQNVAGSAEFLNRLVAEVASTGESLSQIASQLKDGVGNFKLDEA